MTQYGPQYGQPNFPPPGRPTPHRAKTPWWQRTWFLVAATAVVALGVGAAAGGANGDKKPEAGPTVTATATSTTTAPAPPAETKTLQPTVIRTVDTKTRTVTRTYTPPPKPSFGDGTYEVGKDIRPGQFRTDGESDGTNVLGCYYAIHRTVGSGSIEDIIDNDNFKGPSIVNLNAGTFFEVSGGCEWRHT